MKIILDQNIINDIIADEKIWNLFYHTKSHGHITPLFTQVHLDQSNKIKNNILRYKVLFVVNSCNTTATYGHVVGLSREGWSSPTPEETLKEFLGNQKVNHKNQYDALLASTAFHEDAIFITNDKRLKKRCLFLNKPVVMSAQEFKLYLLKMFATDSPSIAEDKILVE